MTVCAQGGHQLGAPVHML